MVATRFSLSSLWVSTLFCIAFIRQGTVRSEEGQLQSQLASDDECHVSTSSMGQDCSLNALQKSGRFSAQRLSVDSEVGSDLLQWLPEAFALEDGSSSPPGDPVKCGDTVVDGRTHGCCADVPYVLTTSGCCNDTKVYSLTTQGCCAERYVYTYSSEQCDPSKAEGQSDTSQSSKFRCAADWPPASTAKYWKRYCKLAGKTKHHIAWAMTPSCKLGWLVIGKESADIARQSALKKCSKRAADSGEECSIFDLDGSACNTESHPPESQLMTCGDQKYDPKKSGCCGGERVYSVFAEDCCDGRHTFKIASQGCCAGRVFTQGTHSCCGNEEIYDSRTHGCCLNKGAEVYRYGTHNCCFHPAGACRIPAGRPSCCD